MVESLQRMVEWCLRYARDEDRRGGLPPIPSQGSVASEAPPPLAAPLLACALWVLERRVLAASRTTESAVSLHADASLLPRRRRARAAWNHHVDDCHAPYAAPAMTYSLNRLENLRSRAEWCVSLNRDDEVDPARLVMRTRYAHPVYDFAALEAQGEMHRIQGVQRTWFSGAWMGNGFHEDGMRAAVGVARALGVAW